MYMVVCVGKGAIAEFWLILSIKNNSICAARIPVCECRYEGYSSPTACDKSSVHTFFIYYKNYAGKIKNLI